MVFYFSGTGNSSYTAKRIAEAVGEELISIATSLRNGSYTYALKENEMVGFVFPTYFYGIPTIVSEFIELLQFKGYTKDNYTFMVCTYGKDSGNLRYDFKGFLKRYGVTLHAAYEVRFPDNYILMFNLLPPMEEIPAILGQADVKIDDVIDAIQEHKRVCPKWSLLRKLKTLFSYPLYKHGRNTAPFHITEKCTRCGKCSRICPSGMIHMLGGSPRWDPGKCTQCLACLHRCPVRAIEYGQKTQKRGRYVNPHIE